MMIQIDGSTLEINDMIKVSREYEPVSLSRKAIPAIEKSYRFIHDLLKKGQKVYGITTGVGDLATEYIPLGEVEVLQKNLVRSHATNVGEPFTEEIVRGIMLLRANALAKGYSGVRVELIQKLIDFLNKGIIPYIPSKGSVGASGDLSPLAHLALVLIGEGECLQKGKRVPAKQILKQTGIEPLTLQAKEGLALINGTQVMASIGCLAVSESELLLKNAQIAGAMSLEALQGTSRAFDEKIHEVRPHAGQIRCANNMRRLIESSTIISFEHDFERIQDAYTLRCIPQVYGAIMDTIDQARRILSIEINSATDNPLIFPESGEVLSGGNFHGEPLAFAMDFLGIAMAEIGNISERTIDRLVNPHVSGLPPFLSEDNGLNSGFMISQYTAAALVSENKVFAHPASVDSIPTSAGQEDHVSMGCISACHAREIVKNVEHVLSIEMLAAAQGIDFRVDQPGKGTGAAWKVIREHVSHMDHDRIMYQDIEKVHQLVLSGKIVEAVEEVVGTLE